MAIVALTVASVSWSVWETESNAPWAYFSTASRAWELGIGAAVPAYTPSIARIPESLRHTLAWIGLGEIVPAVFFMNDAIAFPGPSAAFPVVASALVIAGGTGLERSRLWPLTNRVSRYLGDISYSLYLWHFPVTILLLSLYPGDSAEYYKVGVLVMLILSILSFHLVESPVRHFEVSEKTKHRSSRSTSGERARSVW